MKPDEQEGEPGHLHKRPNYMAIFWWLAGFTAFEVAYSTVLKPPKAFLISGLVLLAGIKAVLVALYFMHLKFDSPVFMRLFIVGLVLATTVYIIMLSAFEFWS